MPNEEIKVVLILSAWGTGSSSVTGFLDKCGVYTCPPHHHTNDPRTPVAYESILYKNALADCFDEFSLKRKGSIENFTTFFEKWLGEQITIAKNIDATHIALKHPLQIFLLPRIEQITKVKYVVVTRPLIDIENTRKRRNWRPVYGEAGAKVIYREIYSYMHRKNKPYLALPYAEFRTDYDLRILLLNYIGLKPKSVQLNDAENWLK
tara:strand:+ start:997 stop:1617 length:621 start_codon:yes stop_codon:yes gene_type:complete